MSGIKIPNKGLDTTGPEKNFSLDPAPNQKAAFSKAFAQTASSSIQLEKTGGQIIARELFKQTAANLGFPKDALSSTLLAFARFFSLSLSPALLGTLRRESLASLKNSLPPDPSPQGSSPKGPSPTPERYAAEKALMENKALALVAALDKGVNLSPEALERYAGFLQPEADATAYGSGGKEGEHREKSQGDEAPRDEAPKDGIPTAEELKAIAEGQAEKDNLLCFLNALPGKNGQYWIVLPFKVNISGTELKVFIRLLKGGCISPTESDCLIADFIGQKKQWRCFLKKNGGKIRADIRVYPEYCPKALKALAKEAERFLRGANGLGASLLIEDIVFKNGEEAASWAEELCEEPLSFINEKV